MRFLRFIAILLILILWYPGWLAFRVWWQSRHDEVHSADVIVVLGAAQYDGEPSPVFRARLDQAAYLYDEDLSDMVIVTGGKQPGDRFTEAEVAENYLVGEHDVEEAAILQEPHGNTTFESLKAVSKTAEDEGLDTALLVSDPLHSERVKRMAADLGFEETYASWASYERLHRSRETKVKELVHEVSALLVYELFDR